MSFANDFLESWSELTDGRRYIDRLKDAPLIAFASNSSGRIDMTGDVVFDGDSLTTKFPTWVLGPEVVTAIELCVKGDGFEAPRTLAHFGIGPARLSVGHTLRATVENAREVILANWMGMDREAVDQGPGATPEEALEQIRLLLEELG